MNPEKVTFINSRGQSVILSTSLPYLLESISGKSEVSANIQSQTAPYQDGFTTIDVLLEARPITLNISIHGNSRDDLLNNRQRLSSIFNSKLGIGKLIYENGETVREIEVVADGLPQYPVGSGNQSTLWQRSLVNLIAPNPYWKSISITEEPAFEPLFQFPFEGVFEMGMQRDRRTIVNDGDSPAPLFVEFFGPALNPKIINNTTGEYIKINQQLHENERMLIDTTEGKKSVFFVDSTGVKRNVFNWIDLNSTFFELVIGENDIEYTADSDIQGAVVNISYSKLHAAI